MAFPKIADVRNLTDEELSAEILELKRKLFDLRFRAATRQAEMKSHEFKHLKHRIAQLMTVERERKPFGRSRKSKKKAAAKLPAVLPSDAVQES